MASRILFLTGSSLLLSGVAASLAECPDFRVTFAASFENASPALAQSCPDVLICDVSQSIDSRILTLMLENPHLLLVGLDSESDRAVLFSGREAHSLSIQQIKELIEDRAEI